MKKISRQKLRYSHISALESRHDGLGLDGSHGFIFHALNDGPEKSLVDVLQLAELCSLLSRRRGGGLGGLSSGLGRVRPRDEGDLVQCGN